MIKSPAKLLPIITNIGDKKDFFTFGNFIPKTILEILKKFNIPSQSPYPTKKEDLFNIKVAIMGVHGWFPNRTLQKST